MNFIMAPAIIGIIGFTIFKLFELYARRRERILIIEKLTSEDLAKNTTVGDLKIGGFSFSALKGGCLLMGLGLGLLTGFIINININLNGGYTYETRSIIYGSCVLLFGGISLLSAFIAELKLCNKKKD